jgi:hypothetical protein
MGCGKAATGERRTFISESAFGLLPTSKTCLRFSAVTHSYSHLDDARQMHVGTPKPLGDCRMGCMGYTLCHINKGTVRGNEVCAPKPAEKSGM